MTITTAMMVKKGAVTYQTDIMDNLGGSLDTSNVGACTTARLAGLDLIWLAKKFGSTTAPTIVVNARNIQDAITDGAKGVLIDAYAIAKPPYKAIVAVLTAQVDPQDTMTDAIAIINSTAKAQSATAEATAFSAVMGA
jgi:hypothetical protein